MNKSTVDGKFNEAKGKVKQAVGETFNNQKMANEGTADQVKGAAQQTWGKVKDSAHDVANTSRANSHNAEVAQDHAKNTRDSIVDGAKDAQRKISAAADHVVDRVRGNDTHRMEHSHNR